MKKIIPWARRQLDRRGIAAVEFALVVPLLLILTLGTIEMLTLYRTEAKLNAFAFNVAQMVADAQAVGTQAAPIADVNASTPYLAAFSPEQVVSLPDICQGALLGVAPFPLDGMSVDIASVTQEQGPNGQPTSVASATYDEWEYDQSVSAGKCTAVDTAAGAAQDILLSTQTSVNSSVSLAMGSMIKVPCDNAIIVQASLPYSGMFGLFVAAGLVLTQTAYVRWAPALPTNELICNPTAANPTGTSCSQQLAPMQICNANNPGN